MQFGVVVVVVAAAAIYAVVVFEPTGPDKRLTS